MKISYLSQINIISRKKICFLIQVSRTITAIITKVPTLQTKCSRYYRCPNVGHHSW